VRNALVECSRTAGTTSSFKYRMTSLHSFSIRSATSPSALFVRVDRSSLLLFFIASLFHELGVWISPLDRPAAIAACLIVLSIPMIQFQVFSAYVDLLGSAGIRAAFALLLGRRSKIVEPDASAFSPSLLAGGISIGTKPVYYFYALVFCLFVAALAWASRSGAQKLSPVVCC